MFAQAVRGLGHVDPKRLYSSLLAQREIRTRNGVFQVKDRFVQFPMVLRVVRNGGVEDMLSNP